MPSANRVRQSFCEQGNKHQVAHGLWRSLCGGNTAAYNPSGNLGSDLSYTFAAVIEALSGHNTAE